MDEEKVLEDIDDDHRLTIIKPLHAQNDLSMSTIFFQLKRWRKAGIIGLLDGS